MDAQIKFYENKLAFEMDPSDLFDKAFIYVTYCDGIGCNASTKGALNMAKLGFQVKELIGGIAWWKFDGYKTEGSQPGASGEEVACAC